MSTPEGNSAEVSAFTNQQSLVPPKEDVRLSKTSQIYDRDKKGYLDEAEKEMRARDSSDKGFLSIDEVYAIVDEKIKAEKDKVHLRRWIIYFAVVVILLIVCNIGTAYLAVYLAKDTETNSYAALVTKGGKDVVATRTTGISFEIEIQFSEAVNASYSCMPIDDIAVMWHEVSSLGSVSLTGVGKNDSSVVIPLSPGGSEDENSMCFVDSNNVVKACVIYEYDFLCQQGGQEDRRERESSRMLLKSKVDVLKMKDRCSSSVQMLRFPTGRVLNANPGDLCAFIGFFELN